MEKLTKFTSCGEVEYCFIQVKNLLFPAVPKSTVKSWLRELNITCKKSTEEQRTFFKSEIPDLNGAFGVIDTYDLQKLLQFSEYKNVDRTACLKKSCDSDVINIDEPAITDLFEDKAGNSACVSSFQTHGENYGNFSTKSEIIGLKTLTTSPTAIATAPATLIHTQTNALNTETSSSGDSTHASRATRVKRYSLAKEFIHGELERELKELANFYRCDINPSRGGCKLTDSTMLKIRERILCFLGFVKIYSPFEKLSINCMRNVKFITEYVKHLTDVRKLMASTVNRALAAILTTIKYICRHEGNIESLPAVVAIKNMQNQLGKEEEITRKRKREGFSNSKHDSFLFEHILDVLRQLRDRYYNESGIASSRHLHDFVFLTLYTRALPGRINELRTLRLIDRTESGQEFQTGNVSELNALVFQPDGRVTLIETDFKTVKTLGPSQIDLSDDEYLVYFLKLYAQGRHRQTLQLGKSHTYFFMNKNGDPFFSGATMSKYISDLFDREIGIRASTTKMRHAICTYFMSMPESDNLKLRESLATLLKHSVRYQQQTYNDTRRQEKVEMGRSFMRNHLLDSDLCDKEKGDLDAVKRSKESLSTSEEVLPQIGELVALLDPASTGPENALIFLAKVLRYTPDKTRVWLQELEKMPDSSDLYRAKCSSTWWENVETLSYPIDMVYVSSEQAYQLRTTHEQIYLDILATR